MMILKFWNGCKNSGKIWWMMKFHYREALTPVLLMKSLQSRLQRDVRIWVSTVFTLISRKTEIVRSVNGPKLQGRHAEDAMAKPYFELQILVIFNSRSQGPKRQLRFSKQSSLRSRGAGSSHSMDPGVSVQKQNFTRNPEKLAKVLGTREETKSHLY